MVGKCALCGKDASLEKHHLVPRMCSVDGIDMDDEDNLIRICQVCHTKLTPRSFMTKWGQARAKEKNRKWEFAEYFLKEVDECEDYMFASDVIDIFNKTIRLERWNDNERSDSKG